MPKVSVIIPTYKRANMLERAINTVLKQTYKNIEIIVVDDNDPSTEYRKNTNKLMEKYKDNNKVKYIKHNKNKNGAAARNTGIRFSTGDLLCFLDDDDWYLENKLELQVSYLLQNPQYKAVYCGWYRDGKDTRPQKEGILSYEILSGEMKIFTNAIMIWRDIAIEIGGWDEKFIRNQEAVFLLRLFNHGYGIGVIPDVLVNFDISDRSNELPPLQNKKLYDFYLDYHKETITMLEKKVKNAKKKIYTKRYRGVLFALIKRREFINALKHYLNTIKVYPIQFNKEIIRHILSKINI
ncbi:glycosyltransferase family 2 protein [Bacilli bacterium]|nr:glycosyltransferase family 2 protein [Bacilli bacterium]PZD86023.1 glycosyltransferase family 2 protein [Bacilli bacterium]PZD89245.1 glycosyltransferase family 2 protein [Bacilli bacterium]RCO05211.1 glycosyltransferase family 2 protein [Bacilli bacterium]RCO09554.1 glycosyltransferase family 2 protein [Bacilli bacterium]